MIEFRLQSYPTHLDRVEHPPLLQRGWRVVYGRADFPNYSELIIPVDQELIDVRTR